MRRLCFLVLMLLTGTASALQSAGLSIDSMEGAGWRAEGLQLLLELQQEHAGRLQIRRLQLPEPLGDIHDLKLDCTELVFTPVRIACLDAPMKADWRLLDKPSARASFDYDVRGGRLQLKLQQLAALGGGLELSADLAADGWQLHSRYNGLQAEKLAPLLEATGRVLAATAGRLDGSLQMQGDDQRQRLQAELRLSGITGNDETGELASEKLSLSLKLNANGSAQRWQADVALQGSEGQLYINPVFLDAGQYPAQLNASLTYRPDSASVDIRQLRLQQSGVARLEAVAQLLLEPAPRLVDLALQIEELALSGAYPLYLQPFLLGTGLDELETGGQMQGQLELAGGAPQSLQLKLKSVTAHDVRQRFSIDALGGEINWNSQTPQARPSHLQWAGGSAYKLPFEAAELKLQTAGKALKLLQPLHLPLLGGALRVQTLAAQNLGADDLALQFDGELQPLDLTRLTRALGWPEFAGTLGGRLPDLSYSGGDLTVGGTLAADVFDGKVAVDGLRIADPFGRLPRLQADIRMRGLDLKKATSAFQFGAIEGRLDGEVSGLRLLNWQPVSFDARLYTQPDDRSRHRISQRAIENISSLGGAGAGAALSRGFMQFFENFAYDRLGLSCRLANGVCRMGGIEDAPDKGGYYLVKGKLLPRIDVIGFAREVSWPALMEQLRSIAEGDGPELR